MPMVDTVVFARNCKQSLHKVSLLYIQHSCGTAIYVTDIPFLSFRNCLLEVALLFLILVLILGEGDILVVEWTRFHDDYILLICFYTLAILRSDRWLYLMKKRRLRTTFSRLF